MVHDRCLQFSPKFRTTLTYLIYSLFKPQVSVITDPSACANRFYSDLKDSVSASQYSQSFQVQLHHVTHSFTMSHDLRTNQLYSIKSESSQVVILLVPEFMYSQVFVYANHFSLLGATPLWLIPDFRPDKTGNVDADTTRPQPARILSFEIDKTFAKEPYTDLLSVVSLSLVILDGLLIQNNSSR